MAIDLTGYLPDRKYLAGGVVGVATFFVQLGLAKAGIVLPSPYAEGLPLVVGYAVSYITKPAAQDVIKRINDDLAKLAGYIPDPSPAAAAVRAEPAAPTKAP